MAQAFSRLDVGITVMDSNDRLMHREDPDAADVLQRVFDGEGVNTIVNCTVRNVEPGPVGTTIYYESAGQMGSVTVDEILVGAGKTPNVEGLNLEKAGVDCDSRTGVLVDDHLRTSNHNIYAAGDICMKQKFTHAGDMIGEIVTAMNGNIGLKKISGFIHPYPTRAEAIKRIGDEYNRSRLTPPVRKLPSLWFRIKG